MSDDRFQDDQPSDHAGLRQALDFVPRDDEPIQDHLLKVKENGSSYPVCPCGGRCHPVNNWSTPSYWLCPKGDADKPHKFYEPPPVWAPVEPYSDPALKRLLTWVGSGKERE